MTVAGPTARDALQAIANLPAGGSVDIMAGQEQAYRAVEALFTKPPHIEVDASALNRPADTLTDDQEQVVKDAIRSAYDRGYNDSRIAKSVPGDNAPGYRGRDKSDEISGEALARISGPSLIMPSNLRDIPSVPAYAGKPFQMLVDFREAAARKRLPFQLFREMVAAKRGMVMGPISEDGRVAANEIVTILASFNIPVTEAEREATETLCTREISALNRHIDTETRHEAD